MRKRMVRIPIKFDIAWEFEGSIGKVRDDLDELERLGANFIDIEVDQDVYGNPWLEITACNKRLETDEEYKARVESIRRSEEGGNS